MLTFEKLKLQIMVITILQTRKKNSFKLGCLLM